VVIQPGDNLWDVAARALTEQWHRHPSPAEVTPYWRSLIELNRGALRHESDPSLIFADQRFQLPPPPVPPTG
jgi:hypothetical protein